MADKTLLLLRHAKSDWPEDVPDHDRPLAKRGRRDAPRAGRWLHTHGYRPDVVICSTALRTRQTWDLVASNLGTSPAPTFEPRAYAASAQTLLYLARELQPVTRVALVIAHNPGISELASILAASEGTTRRTIGFPTTGLGVLTFAGTWADLAPGAARLDAFVTPADM
ncbi:MAG TPA: histidine phosphatase family protein [Streptosporangiaceae bacterium]|nr:histidine phosphatase family protein [Streptosporangiaceae bacterium]